MDITQEFRESADRLFSDFATVEALSSAETGEFPLAAWEAIDAAGFGLVMVPEAQGGVGAGLAEAAAILQSAGEHAVPGPLLEWMLGNWLLALAGRDISPAPLALAFAADYMPAGTSMQLRNVGWVRSAAYLLVLARTSTGTGLAILPAHAVDVQPEVSDACGEPLAQCTLRADAQWHFLPGIDYDGCLRRAAVLRGAQMAGAMRWCLQRSVDYAQERKQFGREISKFQVVQQMLAEMASAVVASQAMLDAAVAEPDQVALVAAARSRLGDAADVVFAHAHQVHGAIGFSHEYVLHFRTRRLMAWRDQFGAVPYWRRLLAQRFVGRKADEVWPVIAG